MAVKRLYLEPYSSFGYKVVKKGDFVIVEFTGRFKETNEVFDTTSAEVAKKSGIFREREVYEPVLIIAGEGWVVPGFDKAILESDVGQRKLIEVEPQEGFGARDPSKIKIVSEREFLKRNIKPEVGKTVEVNGQLAIIRTVNAGRVQLDFNHPYSGKTLVYEFEIKKIVTDPVEKVIELIHRLIPTVSRDKFKVSIDDSNVRIEIPEELLYSESLQSFKIRLVRDVIKYLDNIESVIFIEKFTYKLPQKQTEVSKETIQSEERKQS